MRVPTNLLKKNYLQMKQTIPILLHTIVILFGCNLKTNNEPELKSGSLSISLDSITVKSPNALVKHNLNGKLSEIFTIENNLYTVVDDLNHNIYIIKNFETLTDSLKFPESYYKSNNAPFFTYNANTLYFLVAYTGNLYKYELNKDTNIVLLDSLYKYDFLKKIGLCVSFYRVNNTFNNQIKLINNELYFITIPSEYNIHINDFSGIYSNHTDNYPFIAKYNLTNKTIDTLNIREPVVPDFLYSGMYSSFYVCYMDSLIVCTSPSNVDWLIYNLRNNQITKKTIISTMHEAINPLKENDDIFSYYFNEPNYSQILFNNNNGYKMLFYNLRQLNKNHKDYAFDDRPKNLILVNPYNEKIYEATAPDSLYGFYKFTYKNDFYYSKIPNNDSTITFYKFSVVK
jgi:hypothetical protein